jgi:hypothetical protein
MAILTVHDHDNPNENRQLFLFKTNTVGSNNEFGNSPEWNATFLIPGVNSNCTIAVSLFKSKLGARKGLEMM